MEGPLSILILIPQSSFDGSGIVRPFTKIVSHLNIQFRGIQQKLMKLFNWKLNGTQVWISLLVAIPFTFFFLYLLSTFAPRLLKHKARSQTNKTQSFTVSKGVLYVISSLLGQGSSQLFAPFHWIVRWFSVNFSLWRNIVCQQHDRCALSRSGLGFGLLRYGSKLQDYVDLFSNVSRMETRHRINPRHP